MGEGGWLEFKSKEIKDEDKTRKFNDAINNNFNTFSWPKKVEMLCKQKKFFPKNFFLSTKQSCVKARRTRTSNESQCQNSECNVFNSNLTLVP